MAGGSPYTDAVARAKEMMAQGQLGPLDPGGADVHTVGGGNARAHQDFSQTVADATLGVDGEGDQPGAPDGQQRIKTKVGGDTVSKSFQTYVEIKKNQIDKKHGVVFGWAMVCKDENGNDYVDVQNDNIPEDAMLDAVVGFCENGMVAKEMHQGGPKGQHLFLFPLTGDIAKALGIETKKTGCLIGYKPPDDILAKFESGEYTGFSIGGQIKDAEQVD